MWDALQQQSEEEDEQLAVPAASKERWATVWGSEDAPPERLDRFQISLKETSFAPSGNSRFDRAGLSNVASDPNKILQAVGMNPSVTSAGTVWEWFDGDTTTFEPRPPIAQEKTSPKTKSTPKRKIHKDPDQALLWAFLPSGTKTSEEEEEEEEPEQEPRSLFQACIQIFSSGRQEKAQEEEQVFSPKEELDEAEARDQAMGNKILELLNDVTKTAPQKAKELARFAAKYGTVFKNVGKYAWEAAMWWMMKRRGMIITGIVMTVGVGVLFQLLLPFLGVGAFVGAVAHYSMRALYTMVKVWAVRRVFDWAKNRPFLKPLLERDLLSHPYIKDMLSKFSDQTGVPGLKLDKLLTVIIGIITTYMSVGSYGTFVLGGISIPGAFVASYLLPVAPSILRWSNTYIIKPAASGVGSAARVAFHGGVKGSRAAKRALTAMFEEFQTMHKRAEEELIETLDEETTQDSRSSPLQEWIAEQKEPPTAEQVMAKAQELLQQKPVEPIDEPLAKAMESTMIKMNKRLDQEIDASLRDIPRSELDDLGLHGGILPRASLREVVSDNSLRAVQNEIEANVAHAVSSRVWKTTALVGGAIVIGAMAYQFDLSSQLGIDQAIDTLSSMVPAGFKGSIGPAVLEAAQSPTGTVILTILYQMLSQRFGSLNIVSKLAEVLMIPLSKLEAIKKLQEELADLNKRLDQELGENSKNLIEKRGTIARKILSLLIGSQLYTREQILRMKRADLIAALKDANADLPTPKLPDEALRDALGKIQRDNVSRLHKVVLQALMTTVASGVSVVATTRLGPLVFQSTRSMALEMLKDEKWRKSVGITEMEAKGLQAVLSKPPEQDATGISFFGYLTGAAERVADKSSEAWEALYSGMVKLRKAFGEQPQPIIVEGSAPTVGTIPANPAVVEQGQDWIRKNGGEFQQDMTPVATMSGDSFKNAIAQAAGFANWNDMKKAETAAEFARVKAEEEAERLRLAEEARRRTEALLKRVEEIRTLFQEKFKDKMTEEQINNMLDGVRKKLTEEELATFLDDATAMLQNPAMILAAAIQAIQGYKPTAGMKPMYAKAIGPMNFEGPVLPTRPEDILPPNTRDKLNFKMIPLWIKALMWKAESIEGMATPLNFIIRQNNMAADTVNTVLLAHQIVDAIFNTKLPWEGLSEDELEDDAPACSYNPFNTTPLCTPAAATSLFEGFNVFDYLPAPTEKRWIRMETLTETLAKQGPLAELIKKEEFNLAEVVGQAYMRHILGQTSRAGMIAEIAKVISLGPTKS